MKCNYRVPFGPSCEKDAAVFSTNTAENHRCCLEHAIEVDKSIEYINDGIKAGISRLKNPLSMPEWRSISEYPEKGVA